MRKPFKQRLLFFLPPSVPVYVDWLSKKFPGSLLLAYHPEYEFQFIKRGRGAYYIDGKTWSFGARDLIIIRPNQIHSFIPDTDVVIEKARIMFQGEWLGERLRSLKIDKTFPSLIHLPDLPATNIEMILNRILDENARREKGWEGMIRDLLHEFLLWVIREKDQPVRPWKENVLFTQLRQYIESHYADPDCNVTLIAKTFGYSPNYLSALFKEACGIGMKQYLLHHRIIAARQILDKNPELKTEAIARQAGFDRYRNFARAFFRLTGISSAAYRRKRLVHR